MDQQPNHRNEVLDYEQAAALMGVRVGTLYAWVSQQRIPHIRIGRRMIRFRRTVLLSWLAEHDVPVGNQERGQPSIDTRPPSRLRSAQPGARPNMQSVRTGRE